MKGALSKYDHHFAIKEKLSCTNQDLKMFKILNAEQILEIVQLIRVLEDFVREQSVQ